MYSASKLVKEETYNWNECMKLVEDFYRSLHNVQPRIEVNTIMRDAPVFTAQEGKRLVTGMKRRKAPKYRFYKQCKKKKVAVN